MSASTKSRARCTAALSRAVARMMAQRLISPVMSNTPPRYLNGLDWMDGTHAQHGAMIM